MRENDCPQLVQYGSKNKWLNYKVLRLLTKVMYIYGPMELQVGIEEAETDFWEVSAEKIHSSKCTTQKSKIETKAKQKPKIPRHK